MHAVPSQGAARAGSRLADARRARSAAQSRRDRARRAGVGPEDLAALDRELREAQDTLRGLEQAVPAEVSAARRVVREAQSARDQARARDADEQAVAACEAALVDARARQQAVEQTEAAASEPEVRSRDAGVAAPITVASVHEQITAETRADRGTLGVVLPGRDTTAAGRPAIPTSTEDGRAERYRALGRAVVAGVGNLSAPDGTTTAQTSNKTFVSFLGTASRRLATAAGVLVMLTPVSGEVAKGATQVARDPRVKTGLNALAAVREAVEEHVETRRRADEAASATEADGRPEPPAENRPPPPRRLIQLYQVPLPQWEQTEDGPIYRGRHRQD